MIWQRGSMVTAPGGRRRTRRQRKRRGRRKRHDPRHQQRPGTGRSRALYCATARLNWPRAISAAAEGSGQAIGRCGWPPTATSLAAASGAGRDSVPSASKPTHGVRVHAAARPPSITCSAVPRAAMRGRVQRPQRGSRPAAWPTGRRPHAARRASGVVGARGARLRRVTRVCTNSSWRTSAASSARIGLQGRRAQPHQPVVGTDEPEQRERAGDPPGQRFGQAVHRRAPMKKRPHPRAEGGRLGPVMAGDANRVIRSQRLRWRRSRGARVVRRCDLAGQFGGFGVGDGAALGLVHRVLHLAGLVVRHAGAGGDQAADDDVFLQAAQLVALAHDRRFGQHAGRFLERCGAR